MASGRVVASAEPVASGEPAASAEPVASGEPVASSEPVASVFVASLEPTAVEWLRAAEIAVKGARSAGCEAKLVREWLRLRCTEQLSLRGKPVRIDVIKGKLTGRPKGESLREANGAMTVIVQMLPLTDFKAQLAWEAGELELTAARPEKGALPADFARFDVEDEGPAAASAPATGSTKPATSSAKPAR